MSDRATSIQCSVAQISPKTRWIFVEVLTSAGLRGCGEATLIGKEDAVIASLARLSPTLLASPHASPASLPRQQTLASLPDAAAFSSVDQALWDVEGQRRGIPVARALRSVRRECIPLYANINRRTVDRSSSGFAESARLAVAAGYDAIKIAPFDEVDCSDPNHASDSSLLTPGLSRIEAVRTALGPNRRLMVDCHWRFDEEMAKSAIAGIADYRLYWIECPLPETLDNLVALRRLRALANHNGVRLAGCEQNIREDGFAPFLRAGAYDVMMPDVKYVGGLEEMLELGTLFASHGVEFSPHNPSGPVCHAASVQVCAVAESVSILEMQFDESPWFNALQEQVLPEVVSGAASVVDRPGFGVALNRTALDKCRVASWSSG
jgi:galactonate dehydratase